MKVYLDTIGCRLNQAEIEQYARQFRAAGHTLVAEPGEADLAVVNTCTVTGAAASDSRHKIRQIERLGVDQIVATGCWATLNPTDAARLPNVRRVVANSEKENLVVDILEIQSKDFDIAPIDRRPLPGLRWRTRLFIKAQDGCNNRCSFCITTLARGRAHSRTIPEILGDIHSAEGTNEIVLTGVHLGSWGQDFPRPSNLQGLVRAILTETNIPRVRLSSLEPWDLGEEFFELWQDPRLCRHLHLPLQSGCAPTLRRMRRKTTPDTFAALVETARRTIPGIAITTDLIAGFPGETEREFQESLEFVRQMKFAGGHVFSYSPRPGTAAASMPAQVPDAIRKAHGAELRVVLSATSQEYQQRFIGQVLPVLWESATGLGAQGWTMSGLTENYLRVRTHAPRALLNQVTPVRLTEAGLDGLYGQIQP